MLLTRQASFLRKAIKSFRAQKGKAKKNWTKSSILLTESYPTWKVDTLLWMQSQYDKETKSFPLSFMKDLKGWTGKNISDKKLIKFAMQFASFMKKEVDDVGIMAMDVKLPFDQNLLIEGSMAYIKAQLQLETIDIIQTDSSSEGEEVPQRISDNVTPGKPYLWIR